jgi:cob(I)alamin adenosyltransferase
VIVFTGDGKGKSSAALGITLRAFGHKMYVSFVQFIKGQSDTGESRAVERLAPEVVRAEKVGLLWYSYVQAGVFGLK